MPTSPSTARLDKSRRPPTPRLSRVERKKRDKLERIKRAARALSAGRGFEATTTREIAAAADVGIGTVFLHVTSKQDMLVMISREEAGRAVEAALHHLAQEPLVNALPSIFDALIAHHKRNIDPARVFVKELHLSMTWGPDAGLSGRTCSGGWPR
jgi:AcrR family transcriptional regulator